MEGCVLSTSELQMYHELGYLVCRQLFSAEEVEHLRNHYMDLRSKGSYPGDFEGVDPQSSDPLKRYPRMIHMHRWDEVSLKWLLDARIANVLTQIAGKAPFAVQTMLYFKPPGARGQAMHQDQYYLRVKPGTCLAAWLALDDCDEENGCMQVVPGSHRWPLLCTEQADTRLSFTDVTVPLPNSTKIDAVRMQAGDVLFFNGQLVHGSLPNVSQERFRRALIGHYIEGKAEAVHQFYQPVLKMDGTALSIDESTGGGPCGIWVEQNGAPSIEMSTVME
jgi:phytanoyl-CoA hydroxylase